uniref:Aminoacylase-1-like n=1 Tax=Cucumis melo TaxID=3656 RepID=A0A9I9DP87_CUCME
MEIGGSDGATKFVQSKEFKELNVGFMMDEGQASPGDEFRVFYADRSPWSLIIKAKGTPGHGSRMYDNSAMENLMKSVEIISRFREGQFEIVKVASANPPSPRSVAANRAQPSEPIVVTKVDTEIQGVRKVEEVSDSDGDGDVE